MGKYKELYETGQYGIVTGWGQRKSGKGNPMSNELKQMQMQVKSHDECLENISEDNRKKVNDTLMFCAGGEGTLYLYTFYFVRLTHAKRF